MNSNEDFDRYVAEQKEADRFFWGIVAIAVLGIANLAAHVLLGSL
jgi:hypothetical protein